MINDAIRAAIQAGFEDDGLVYIVAIGGRESGWDPAATADTRRFTRQIDGGIWQDPATFDVLPEGIGPEYSVGWLQINLSAHPDILEDAARDYLGAAKYAYELSKQGRDFSPWSTAPLVTAEDHAEARDVISAVRAAMFAESHDTTPRQLDVATSLMVLETAIELVQQGRPMQAVAGPDRGQIAISLSASRSAFVEASPTLDDELPGAGE